MPKGLNMFAGVLLVLALSLGLAGTGAIAADSGGGQQDSGSTAGGNQDGGDGQDGGSGGDDGDGGGGQDIVTVLQSRGDFNRTADAIEQAGLAETLQGQGPFTVFAPTDAAWQKLPEEERNLLMSDEGLSRLRTLLSYHVVPDAIRANDVQQMGSLTTIQGQPLQVSRAGDQLTVNDATVTQPGLQAGNGIVHGIDKVLMPQR